MNIEYVRKEVMKERKKLINKGVIIYLYLFIVGTFYYFNILFFIR